MKMWAIVKKELRSAFLSPVALIFLTIFLFISLFVFFFMESFFARNIADIRPYFKWMPVLLLFLSAAFTMRLWSEEERSGTIEVLFTLPVSMIHITLGKFIAGLLLVATALVFTLPIPITVSMLGSLDWGPVWGGYVGLLFLSAAYLSMGLMFSAISSSQLVALLLTLIMGGSFILIGYLPEVFSFGFVVDELLRSLGTSSRFESLLRGVIDLRDIVYYCGLAGLFLAITILILEKKRWGQSKKASHLHRQLVVVISLIILNIVVFNIGISPYHHFRADLTQWEEYSVSPVTKKLLASAKQPLLIRGYFSQQTHPLLDPLVPRIHDFLKELESVGGNKITVEIIDPTSDPLSEREAYEKYSIKSVPFRFASRHQDSVVNAYFHILLRYGDDYNVLAFNDLIDVQVVGNDLEVRLRNLEYDIARSIQKLIYGFSSLETICQALPSSALLKVFASKQGIPEDFASIPQTIEKVAMEFQDRCQGRFNLQVIDPSTQKGENSAEAIHKKYGIQPMAVSLFDQQTFYLDLVLEVGDKWESINAAASLNEADIKKELEAALKRHAPGFTKTIGLVVPQQAAPRYPGMPPQGSTFEMLQKHLEQTYQVEMLQLKEGRVPGNIDVLYVIAQEHLEPQQVFAIDQYLMRGGAVVLATGKWTLDTAALQNLNVKPIDSGMEDVLKQYGVELGKDVVLDEVNAAFPVPVERDVGGLRLREIQMMNYPPFVLVSGQGLSQENPITKSLPMVVMHWPTQVSCMQPDDKQQLPKCDVLLQSSPQAWQAEHFTAQPNFELFPELGFATAAERSITSLGVTVAGPFTSYFKEHPVPGMGDEHIAAGVLEYSKSTSKLVVLGSTSFIEDLVLSISQQTSDLHQANLQLMSNIADWAVSDEDLLKIRSKEQYARTLYPIDDSRRIFYEVINFIIALAFVMIVGLYTQRRRSQALPILAAKNMDKTGGNSNE